MDSAADGAPVIRAVVYHRVCSELPADQDSAIRWQAARVAKLAERLNLKATGIYTDLAVARSTPWSARPAARRLTKALTDRIVVADTVVVDEPQHTIGPDNIRAALAAIPIPIPLCTPGAGLHTPTAPSARSPEQ